jgi:phenylpyruvate tautomerase PptA (4-oxalocrotonate tautomerase family)
MRQPDFHPKTKSTTGFNMSDQTKRRRAERITSIIGGVIQRTPNGTTIVIDPVKQSGSGAPTWI